MIKKTQIKRKKERKRFKTKRCLINRWDPKRNLIKSKGYKTVQDPRMIESNETKKTQHCLKRDSTKKIQ
jgi:hypothetical protein